MKTKIKVHGIVREVFVELETVRNGREMIIYREYLPNGKLGKMYHSTSKENIIQKELYNKKVH